MPQPLLIQAPFRSPRHRAGSIVVQRPIAQALGRQAEPFEPGDQLFPLPALVVSLGFDGRLDLQHDSDGAEERWHIALQPFAAERQIGRLQPGEGHWLAVGGPGRHRL